MMQLNNSIPPDELLPREPTPAEKKWRFFLGIVSAVVIIGFLYITTIRLYTLYYKTPVSIQQPPVVSVLDAETLSVPLTVFILRNDSFGSERDEDNVKNLIQNADNLWEQASIDLTIQEINTITLSDDQFKVFYEAPRDFVQTIQEFDPQTINVFLPRGLRGINGISFGGIRSVAVADYTTVYDFRALAHEVGHQLGLAHVQTDTLHLMSEGVNGIELETDEIMTAREFAVQFTQE